MTLLPLPLGEVAAIADGESTKTRPELGRVIILIKFYAAFVGEHGFDLLAENGILGQ